MQMMYKQDRVSGRISFKLLKKTGPWYIVFSVHKTRRAKIKLLFFDNEIRYSDHILSDTLQENLL